jgi:glycosyltransferase involved in cell wall biosynthesis
LVPNYNYVQYLGEAIGSVLAQDFTDFELIVSDDASTDDSPTLLAELASRDSRVQFFRQPTNLGLVRNLNWCLGRARGEYIKFLLSDDKLVRPDALRRLVAMLDAAPDIVLASSAALIIDEHSEVQHVRDYLGRDLLEDGQVTCRRCLQSRVNQIGEPSLTLFRHRCAGDGFNPGYRLWVDVEFALRVLEQGRFSYCREPLSAFRFHSAQETRRLLAEDLLPIEFCQMLVEFADRPWFGRHAAREKLFEELYQDRKRGGKPHRVSAAVQESLRLVGSQGYGRFLVRRKLRRPFENLRRALAKRRTPHPPAAPAGTTAA